jgi:hydrogenase expression/formation protein HypC
MPLGARGIVYRLRFSLQLKTSVRQEGLNLMCLAIPGKLVGKQEANGILTGRVQFGGVVREACLDFLPEAEIGDYVLVHVGFAISRVNEEDAKTSLEFLQKSGMLEAELSDGLDSDKSIAGPAI